MTLNPISASLAAIALFLVSCAGTRTNEKDNPPPAALPGNKPVASVTTPAGQTPPTENPATPGIPTDNPADPATVPPTDSPGTTPPVTPPTATPPATPPTATPPATPPPSASIPYGTPVIGKKGFVYSPFAPEKGMVDVSEIPSGTKVECPFTGKVFRVP